MKNSFKLVSENWWYAFGTFIIINTGSYPFHVIFKNFSVKDSVHINYFLQNSFSIIFIAPLSCAFAIALLYNLRAKNRSKLECVAQ
jgi:hypothetical protein